VTALSEYEIRRGKMNLQLVADEENQDRAQCGKNEAGGMISFVCRARKHVGNAAADDRSEDASTIVQKIVMVHVHHRFRDNPRESAQQEYTRLHHSRFPVPLTLRSKPVMINVRTQSEVARQR
jgi:hypothetical protein